VPPAASPHARVPIVQPVAAETTKGQREAILELARLLQAGRVEGSPFDAASPAAPEPITAVPLDVPPLAVADLVEGEATREGETQFPSRQEEYP
jgi:hypothetical protein